MAREQAEYDRLISGITDTTPGFDYLESKSDQDANRGLLRTTIRSTSTEEPQSVSNIPTYLQDLMSCNFSSFLTTLLAYLTFLTKPFY